MPASKATKSSSTAPAKASTGSADSAAPASRTIHRSAETGKLVTADEAAANPKGTVAEVLAPSYDAEIVNASARANGVRVTLDIAGLSPSQVDLLASRAVKAHLRLSV